MATERGIACIIGADMQSKRQLVTQSVPQSCKKKIFLLDQMGPDLNIMHIFVKTFRIVLR